MDKDKIFVELNEGDRVLRKNTIEYLKNTIKWDLEVFIKTHTGEIQKWLDELDVYEKAFLFCIGTFIGYTDCCIQYDNGKPIGTEDLIKLCGFKRTKAYQVINSLRKKDILLRCDSSIGHVYLMNPWIYCKGNRINKVLKKIFENYKVKVCVGIEWKYIDD